MKKLILAAGLLLIATMTSCKKDEKASAGTWKVNGVEYQAYMVLAPDNAGIIMVYSQDVQEINMEFRAPPASSGNYKIVGGLPIDNEISFNTRVGLNESYTADGDDGKSAAITLSGGKIRVQMTDVKLKGLEDSSARATFSCDITGTIIHG